MKNYAFYYDKMPISKNHFLANVPENWEEEIEDFTYSYGYYRANVIEE